MSINLAFIFYSQPSEKSALTISRNPIMRVPVLSGTKQQHFVGVRIILEREKMCKYL
jgi:hypothetical protein